MQQIIGKLKVILFIKSKFTRPSWTDIHPRVVEDKVWVSVSAAPEPPTNLTVTLGRNKQATISWAPPAHGDYTGFRFKVRTTRVG